MINILGNNNTLLDQFIYEIRDENIQNDRQRFRRNLERIGEIFAYEISKKLNFENKEVKTPLGTATVPVLTDKLVLATILRAGIPLHQGLLNYFDKADNLFIGAYRKYHKNGEFEIQFEYISSPELENKTLVLADPMIATGASIELAYRALLEFGNPSHTHIVTAIASKEGIEYIRKNLSNDKITIWVGCIDNELTAKSYIVPGLGDAGDLAYGKKTTPVE